MTLHDLVPFLRNEHFRASADKLRITQLRYGSNYYNLRSLVPVFALVIVWTWVNFAYRLNGFHRLSEGSVTVRHLLVGAAIISAWNLWLSLSIFTQHSIKRDLIDEFSRLTIASMVCGALPIAANLLRGLYVQGFILGELTSLVLFLVSLGSLGVFLVGAFFSKRLMRSRSALVVGSGRRASMLRARLKDHYSRFNIFGCVDDSYVGRDAIADNYLGPLSRLAEILKTEPIEVVLIGLPLKSQYDQIQQVIDVCEMIGVESHYMQDIFETSRAHLGVHTQEPAQFAVLSSIRDDPKQRVKRILDFVLAGLILVFFSPILVCAAAAIRFTSPGPVFFVQQRYGLNRKRFPMFKFRSMIVDAEQKQFALERFNEAHGPVFKLKQDPRVTSVGAFLRKSSIDELPQLFNVLRGEMSLVGPRPLPLRDVSRFESPWLLRRFSVRPGITCLWQVNGRSNTSFDAWITQDLQYIDQWSLALDFKILFKTIPAVLKGSGAV